MLKQFLPKGRQEARIAVANDRAGKRVEADDGVVEEFGERRSISISGSRDEVCHFGEAVDDDEDGVEVVRFGELRDEVKGQVLP